MNKHDQERKEQVIKTLIKALSQIEIARLYLAIQDPLPQQEIYELDDAHEHVCIALERLGVDVEGGDNA